MKSIHTRQFLREHGIAAVQLDMEFDEPPQKTESPPILVGEIIISDNSQRSCAVSLMAMDIEDAQDNGAMLRALQATINQAMLLNDRYIASLLKKDTE